MDKLIDSNQIKLHSSIEFKKYQSDSNTIDNQIAALQNRLSVLNNSTAQNNNTALNEINNKLVEKRANLTTIPVTQKTQRKRNDMQNEIDSLEKSKSELINIASSLNKSLSEKQTEANNIIKTLQELNNKKESLDKKLSTNTTTITNNISKEDEINYWTYFFIFLEIARCILWKDSKQKGYFSGNSTTFKDRLSKWLNPQIPTAVTASKENTIGFKYAQESHLTNKHSVNALQNTLETLSPTLEVNDIKISVPDALNKNDVKRYLEYMYDNAIGNISPGSNLIARQIGISTETARKIRALLEGHNVVKSDKSTKKTVILNYL
jgi:predicted  nucleic acid-binding Zn-ribbon protein